MLGPTSILWERRSITWSPAVRRFRASIWTKYLRGHLHEELTPPDHINQNLSSGLGEVVECLMAKNRDKRYRNADDLIVDLEYLMNGALPKLARSRLEADTLKGLQEGETENEDDRRPKPAPLAWWLAGILGGLLGLSLLFNLFLLLRR